MASQHTAGDEAASNARDRATVLIVDDTPANVQLLGEVLGGIYRTKAATSGERALKLAMSDDPPDLVLLDVMMPGMSGYEVCERLKAEPRSADIPVIFVTAMGEVDDETRGLALGAVDYITKPISPPIVLARVAAHLTLARQRRALASAVAQLEAQAAELAEWNRSLESRVAEGVAEVERLARLRRFFSPGVADLILSGAADDPLKTRRREIVVAFLDLRGFTAFAEVSDPEDVMRVLGDYHAAMGELILEHGGTLERFAGDGMMIFFNDPVQIDAPALTAVRMAQQMQRRFVDLSKAWRKLGIELAMGIGIAQGYATIGAIGFEGRRDYGAIGVVTNLAARLCGEAAGGQILLSQRAYGAVEEAVEAQPIGPLALRGFHGPVNAFAVSWND
ncbi:MAG: response regulator [Burkholderiales bacterium]|nr:MAG: response regulator [Burkholderiales bacterium]